MTYHGVICLKLRANPEAYCFSFG